MQLIAATENVVPVPSVMFLSAGCEVIDGGTGSLMTIVKALVASGFIPLLALTVNVNVPTADGVPEMIPDDGVSVNPVGKEPDIMLQVIGVVPVAARVAS